jgi:molecular chaperone HscB
MQPTMLQVTRHATRDATKEIARLTSARAPYICASCRRATISSSATTVLIPPIIARGLSTTRLRRQEAPNRETVLPQTYFDLFPETYPSGPPPASPFTPNQKSLRKEFLQLQAKAHPDLASSDKKRQAEAISARINEAYRTLQDPLRRAQYLLSHQGIDVENESAKLSENQLLMEVMEAREAVDEAEDEAGLVAIREENNGRIDQSVKMLEECFAQGRMDQAATEAIRLRYWMNIEESIHGWEKGVGGGANHH